MIKYLWLYLLTVPVFFAIDMVWLGLVAKNFYRSQLGDFLGPVNWTAAVVFYFLFIAGIIIFAVLPALNEGGLMKVIVLGALFGPSGLDYIQSNSVIDFLGFVLFLLF